MEQHSLFEHSEVEASAVISMCGRYRYALNRRWANGNTVLFIMLNPSTADAKVNDATIRRCIGFAKRWGYSSLAVGNLFAFRATDPKELAAVELLRAQVGPMNDDALKTLMGEADRIVVAWGSNKLRGAVKKRVEVLLRLAREEGQRTLFSVGTTRDGSPRHPLYVRADAEPREWPEKKTRDALYC